MRLRWLPGSCLASQGVLSDFWDRGRVDICCDVNLLEDSGEDGCSVWSISSAFLCMIVEETRKRTTPRPFLANTDRFQEKAANHMFACDGSNDLSLDWGSRCEDVDACLFGANGYNQGSPPSSVAAAVPTEAEGANVHFLGESAAHGGEHLRRPTGSPSQAMWDSEFAINANHKQSWCFISPRGCGIPTDLSRLVLLAKVNVVRTDSPISVKSNPCAAARVR